MRSEFLLATLLLAALFLSGCSGLRPGSGLNTADLGGKQAPDFALVNQLGEPVRLGDLRGKAVAITFLYT
ncbi:MAG: SCO family protein, partial [Actinobacteria bacterium]|nr:SCO family protein [Actinomycetota bacterium]